MTVDFTKWTDILKLKPTNILPVTIATGFVLIAPKCWLNTFGIATLINKYRPWIGIAFIASSAFFISTFIFWTIKIINAKRIVSKTKNRGIQRLGALTPNERDILKWYFINNTRTQILNIDDGVVNELAHFNLIYPASMHHDSFEAPYNIQPWAWDYLNKHRNLLGLDD